MPDYTFIDSAEAFHHLLTLIQRSSEVGIDLEADSFHHYYTQICLVQLAIGDKSWIIDPLADQIETEQLASSLAGKTLLLHGGDYDLRLMHSLWDFCPTQIFDTAIAARLLGHRSFGLGHLVKHYFGVQLDKSKQKADWAKRPLTPDLLEYAAGDTAYLIKMVEIMRDELERMGRTNWAEESCQRQIKVAQEPSPHSKEEGWRLSGHSRLSQQELSLLKALWHWRDREAEKRNLAPFKVLTNDRLLSLARKFSGKGETTVEELSPMPRNFSKERIESLAQLIRNEALRPPEEWPKHKRSRPPYQPTPDSRIVDKLKAIRTQLAEKLNIEETLLATKPQITSLALHDMESEEEIRSGTAMMEWQYELFMPHIVGLKP